MEDIISKENLDIMKNTLNFFILLSTAFGILTVLHKNVIETLGKETIEILTSGKWDSIKHDYIFYIVLLVSISFMPLLFCRFYLNNELDLIVFFFLGICVLFFFNYSYIFINNCFMYLRNKHSFFEKYKNYIIVFSIIAFSCLLSLSYKYIIDKNISILEKSMAFMIPLTLILIFVRMPKLSWFFRKVLSFDNREETILELTNYFMFFIYFIWSILLSYFLNSLFLKAIDEKSINMIDAFFNLNNKLSVKLIIIYMIIDISIGILFLFFITRLRSNIKKTLKNDKKLKIQLISGKIYRQVKVLNVTTSDYIIEDKDKNQRIISRSLVEEIILPKNQNEYMHRSYTRSRAGRRR